MKLQHIVALFLLIILQPEAIAQSSDSKIKSIYFGWGYNRSAYTNADIKIKGDNENITIHKAHAKDSPSKFVARTYLNPLKFTVPQFDFRIGVELKNQWYISFGWDHLKYVLQPGDYLITGIITEPEASEKFRRRYNDTVFVDDSFLHLEHTDGLNYIHFSVDKVIYKTKFLKDIFTFELPAEVGFGVAAPWTDSDFVGRYYRNPGVRLAGVGLNLGLKPRLYVFKELVFFQSNLRAGYFNLWNVKIHDEVRAKQNFAYAERAFVLGMKFKLGKKQKAN